MKKNLFRNILSTIIYYDILDYPLTHFEIWKYLLSYNIKQEACDSDSTISLLDIIKELEQEDIKKYINEYRGFYFLRGRESLVLQRIESNKISESKYKIIKRTVFWLRWVPYIRMVGITGRMAMKNANVASDLDFLVAIKEGKIFTGRILITLASQLLGRRRYKNKITDRICLNYYLTNGSLTTDLRDLFSSSEYSFIRPVYGFKTFRRFQESNAWIKKYRPNFEPDSIADLKVQDDNVFITSVKTLFEIILNFNFIEKILKKWQMKRIISDPRTYKTGSAVTANDNTLIFIPDPQGPKIYERFIKRMEKVNS